MSEQEIMSPSKLTEMFEEYDMGLLWNRVAISVDPKPKTMGSGILQVSEQHTARPNTGTIVWHGDGIDEDVADKLPLGTRVSFDRMGNRVDYVWFGDECAEMAIMSTRDVYRYWQED